ncbi:MAG: hypothetical protein HMLKMBBP_03126 [Planctomycetes bacterium]|nr:hypothetical protein [Planctomycetota bacterium]
MRLILSRKGFDSSAGGCPSPIFPDGSMLSLPIPDKRSPIRYEDLCWRRRNLGELVERITKGRHRRDHRAHLDPDLRRGLLPRPRGWRPSLGQVGAAQGHLRKQGVAAGDVFLFFGLFRPVDAELRWSGPPAHHIWGWLQVDDVLSVDDDVRRGGAKWKWTARHPHLAFEPDARNTLYVAARRLSLPRLRRSVPGAGVFDFATPTRRLTAADAKSPTDWALPIEFMPRRGRRPLSYHGDRSRWRRSGGQARLRAVAKGQEFVLDLDEYPELLPWLAALLRDGT